MGAAAEPHAAAGLAALLAALAEAPAGEWIYRVPAEHGDGRDRPALVWEVA